MLEFFSDLNFGKEPINIDCFLFLFLDDSPSFEAAVLLSFALKDTGTLSVSVSFERF
jgi:hypothetical protein